METVCITLKTKYKPKKRKKRLKTAELLFLSKINGMRVIIIFNILPRSRSISFKFFFGVFTCIFNFYMKLLSFEFKTFQKLVIYIL